VDLPLLLPIVGTITLLVAAILLSARDAASSEVRARRGWDRFDPLHKLFVAVAGLFLLLLAGRAIIGG